MSMIFLVGMPGAGKSYWAEKISAAYNLSLVDLDKRIEDRDGQTITNIFHSKGEAYFRDLETTLLLEVIADKQNDVIVACGGGTPCFAHNLSSMQQAGSIVYLRADIESLLNRLENEALHRPLLQKGDLRSYLQDLLNKRKHIYEQADHILDTEIISLSTFDKIISSCINRP
ncbi:MAG: shikimate kinase [Flavipsychrobacter sp.]